MTVPPPRPGGLAKQTLDTRYHIDYEWWRTSTEDLRTNLLKQVPPDFKDAVLAQPEDRQFDYIDPKSGRVSRLDALHFALMVASESTEFLDNSVSLADAIFRVLLTRDNAPTSARELAALTGRDGRTILTLLGSRVLYGIRPHFG
ncbi:MAG: hypothetical protein IPK52_08835 [Chloroflexi bacterium]|nr:hypothetical protein [Chloroflexota bacterium]